MMPLEAGLVDTNVLIYAVDADAPQHSASRALLDAAQNGSVRLYVTSQVLCEFYSVITNPRRVTAARSPSEALEALDALINFPGMSILPTPVRAVNGWMELLRRYPVTR